MMYMPEDRCLLKPSSFATSRCESNLLLLFWVVAWQMTLSPHRIRQCHTCDCLGCTAVTVTRHSSRQAYAHAWANFVSILYFLHALTIMYVDGEAFDSSCRTILTTLGFMGNILFTVLEPKS